MLIQIKTCRINYHIFKVKLCRLCRARKDWVISYSWTHAVVCTFIIWRVSSVIWPWRIFLCFPDQPLGGPVFLSSVWFCSATCSSVFNLNTFHYPQNIQFIFIFIYLLFILQYKVLLTHWQLNKKLMLSLRDVLKKNMKCVAKVTPPP